MHMTNALEIAYVFWDVENDNGMWSPLHIWAVHDKAYYPALIIRRRGYPEHSCIGLSLLIRLLYPNDSDHVPERFREGHQPNYNDNDEEKGS